MMLEPIREYAAKRVPRHLWRATGVGGCAMGQYAGNIIVPITGPDGQTWVGWVGRSTGPKGRYSYPKGMPRATAMYNVAAVYERVDRPLLIVEGAFDAIHLWPDSVAVLGKVSAEQVDILATTTRPVAVVMDGDAWAEGLSLTLLLSMRGVHAGNVRLPPTLDPDEVPRAWLDDEVAACLR